MKPRLQTLTLTTLATFLALSPQLMPAAQAETTREMIDRLAREGRSRSWVQPGDCAKEQRAVDPRRAVPGPDARFGSKGVDDESEIAQALLQPWVYRYSGERQGQEMSADELMRRSRSYEQAAVEKDREGARGREMGNSANPRERLDSILAFKGDGSMERLRACAYAVAAQRKSGGAGTAAAATSRATAPSGTLPATPAGEPAGACAVDAAAQANREMLQVDARIAGFVGTPAAQQSGNATPSLQVVMWGAQEQIRIVTRYCPSSPEFRKLLDSRAYAFRLAEEACQKLQSRPEVCVPAAP